MRLKHDGFADPITLSLIAVAICVGCYFMFRSNEVDAPAEQVAEAILKAEGIDVDFSAAKKSNSQVPRETNDSK